MLMCELSDTEVSILEDGKKGEVRVDTWRCM